MIEHKFISYDELKEDTHPLNEKTIASANFPDVTVLEVGTAKVGECADILKKLPGQPLFENGKIVSVVFRRKLLAALSDKKVTKVDKIKYNFRMT